MVHVIALDVGTSSMRALIYDERGALLHTSGCEYHTVFPQPSWVEQDPATWADAALDTLSGASSYAREHGIGIAAITVTSQRASLIPVDRAGQPLRPAIMWQDKRTIAICDRLLRENGLEPLHRKTGLRINPFFVLNKIIWLRENEPETFRRAARFIGVQDYVIHQLTGAFVTDWTQASRTMLMDLRRFAWDDELLQLAGIAPDRLCRLVPPGSMAGTLLPAMAARSGLPSGLPVIIAGGDQQSAALALGLTRQGMAEANTGTGSFVLSYSEQPVFDDRCRVLCQAGAIAGSYVTETPIFNTGAIFRWFKEQFCPDYRTRDDPYALMDDEAAGIPAGSGGVLMLPHFEGSAAPNWNPAAKGLFFNLGLATTRGMMIRAILEGIAFEISENIGLMRALEGEISELHVSGGMVRCDLFCEIQASACGTRVIRHSNPEASSLGATCSALVALGVHPSADAFFHGIDAGQSVFLPDAAESDLYGRILQRRRALYTALNDADVYRRFMGAV